MPKRNRSRELEKYGDLRDRVGPPPNETLAVVTGRDLEKLVAQTDWLKRYVEFIFSAPSSCPTLLEQPGRGVSWGTTEFEDPSLRDFSASAERTGMVYFDSKGVRTRTPWTGGYKIHIRNNTETNMGQDNAGLTIVNGNVVDGRYRYFDYANSEPAPAPDAVFGSLEEAHEKTVSGRLAYLLGEFRRRVSDESGLIVLYAGGRVIPHAPPSELL